jgi:hypothetical protein
MRFEPLACGIVEFAQLRVGAFLLHKKIWHASQLSYAATRACMSWALMPVSA